MRGNALFLILIAVALFAALSYAITQSGRGGGNIDKETAQIDAAQITQIGSEIEQAMNRMILQGTAPRLVGFSTEGGDEHQNGGWGSSAPNSDADFCTTGDTCIFAPEGGGVPLPQVPRGAYNFVGSWEEENEWVLWCPTCYNGVGTDAYSSWAGIGTADSDLILNFGPLKEEVCHAINKGLGIDGIPEVDDPGADVVPNDHAACIYNGRQYTYYVILQAR